MKLRLPVNTLTLSPAAITFAVNTAVTLLVSFGLHLSRVQVGAISTITAGAAAIVMAFAAKPWHTGLIAGAVVSVLTACAAFGLKLRPEQIGMISAVLSIGLGYLTGALVIPAPAARLGTTAHALIIGQAAAPKPPA